MLSRVTKSCRALQYKTQPERVHSHHSRGHRPRKAPERASAGSHSPRTQKSRIFAVWRHSPTRDRAHICVTARAGGAQGRFYARKRLTHRGTRKPRLYGDLTGQSTAPERRKADFSPYGDTPNPSSGSKRRTEAPLAPQTILTGRQDCFRNSPWPRISNISFIRHFQQTTLHSSGSSGQSRQTAHGQSLRGSTT